MKNISATKITALLLIFALLFLTPASAKYVHTEPNFLTVTVRYTKSYRMQAVTNQGLSFDSGSTGSLVYAFPYAGWYAYVLYGGDGGNGYQPEIHGTINGAIGGASGRVYGLFYNGQPGNTFRFALARGGMNYHGSGGYTDRAAIWGGRGYNARYHVGGGGGGASIIISAGTDYGTGGLWENDADNDRRIAVAAGGGGGGGSRSVGNSHLGTGNYYGYAGGQGGVVYSAANTARTGDGVSLHAFGFRGYTYWGTENQTFNAVKANNIYYDPNYDDMVYLDNVSIATTKANPPKYMTPGTPGNAGPLATVQWWDDGAFDVETASNSALNHACVGGGGGANNTQAEAGWDFVGEGNDNGGGNAGYGGGKHSSDAQHSSGGDAGIGDGCGGGGAGWYGGGGGSGWGYSTFGGQMAEQTGSGGGGSSSLNLHALVANMYSHNHALSEIYGTGPADVKALLDGLYNRDDRGYSNGINNAPDGVFYMVYLGTADPRNAAQAGAYSLYN
jgi:hypothetical protein